jgi:hypothetical protein
LCGQHQTQCKINRIFSHHVFSLFPANDRGLRAGAAVTDRPRSVVC